MAGKILVVDDEKDMLALLRRILTERTPHEVVTTEDARQVKELLEQNCFDVVFTDLKMPHMDGVQVLDAVKAKDENTVVVIMTAYATIESAIETTRKGAFDYITKPFRKERILHVLEQGMKWRDLYRENLQLKEQLENESLFPALLGASEPMQRLRRQIQHVAKTTATILITGESGTGKELVARAIHAASLRKNKPFVPIDCSTIPETLIESELFGHVRGAFTGALKDKKGLVEEANQGTLFLDEIGDLSLTMQVKLLRLLQEGEYKVVGTGAIRKADVRYLAATNQHLPSKIRNGDFREDLFYRLNVIQIHLPPLVERKQDIPLLAHHFLQKYSRKYDKPPAKLSKGAIDYLLCRPWPGNVRELGNVLERAVIFSSASTLHTGDLETPEQPSARADLPAVTDEDIFDLPFKQAKDKMIEAFQAEYLKKMLSRHAGNVSSAARDSGIKRQYFHRLIRETDLESKNFRKPDSQN